MSEMTLGSLTKVASNEYSWKIEKFSAIKIEPDMKINSPVFSTIYSSGKILQWRLGIYPNGYDKKDRGYFFVFLTNMNDTEESTAYTLSVVIDSNTSHARSFGETKFNRLGTFGCAKGWGDNHGEPLFMRNGRMTRTLMNDTLTVTCLITAPDIIDPVKVKQKYDDVERTKFRNHFESLLESGDFSDVTFLIGNQGLKLHKAILGGSSSVLYSMFSGDENEANNVNQVTITADVSFEVMKEMFRYVYARKVENIEGIADDLYVVADKYQIEGLKALCDETLCDDLNDDNALPRLDMAVKYDIAKLKPVVTAYVVKKLKYFLKKEQFAQLSPICKDLLLNIVADKLENEL